MRRREEIRRGRFPGKEQPAVDRCGEDCAITGVPGQRVRIGTPRPRIVRPARFRKRFQLASEFVSEETGDLVDCNRGNCAVARVFQRDRSLGQSLAAIRQKEMACASFAEIGRKYPRASVAVKQTVEREQKRVGC